MCWRVEARQFVLRSLRMYIFHSFVLLSVGEWRHVAWKPPSRSFVAPCLDWKPPILAKDRDIPCPVHVLLAFAFLRCIAVHFKLGMSDIAGHVGAGIAGFHLVRDMLR